MSDKINRYETKYVDYKHNRLHLIDLLYSNHYRYIYPTRKITSLYFENIKDQMYLHTEEGINPRKKIRIRYYGEESNKSYYVLEHKESYDYFRKKSSKKISNREYFSFLKNGIWEKDYGLCFPNLLVSYYRNYLFNKENKTRVTLDFNIEFKKFNFSNNFKNNDLVIELKTSSFNKQNILDQYFFSKKRRYSKYLEGFIKVNM